MASHIGRTRPLTDLLFTDHGHVVRAEEVAPLPAEIVSYVAGGSRIILVEVPMPRTRSKPESEWMTVDELPADARLRLEHAGQWVAWDHGMTRILASGSDLKTVHDEVIATGAIRPILEFIPPVETRPDGID